MAEAGSGITLGIALLGAVLGVINTGWVLWKDRVRLRVFPVMKRGILRVNADGRRTLATSQFANILDNLTDGALGIRVTNVGFLTVTVTDLGFISEGAAARMRRSTLKRAPVTADALQAVVLPFTLAPRQSITLWAGPIDDYTVLSRLKIVKRVYVATECGLIFFGTSRLLRALRRRARRAR